MGGAILIIGSLLWDEKDGRSVWRHERLQMDKRIDVKAPIRYGRLSRTRGNTYTMVLSPGGPLGRCALLPLKADFENVDALLREAEMLWQAEAPNAPPGCIGAQWGCVGALFSHQAVRAGWQRHWTDGFQAKKTVAISPVNYSGLIDVSWPLTLNADDADVDLLLATATMADDPPPDAIAVANAWCDQDMGHERYFFENVQRGIRTPDDGIIWEKIHERKPSWLRSDAYSDTIRILNDEQQAGAPE